MILEHKNSLEMIPPRLSFVTFQTLTVFWLLRCSLNIHTNL
ncbi:hypothetical protein HMPREF1579_00458 [Gardnerella vaginalis JCP8066]|nr:hypothetical protein HMPREF1579_00458 [Gardnerella vaginalis JCP8066]